MADNLVTDSASESLFDLFIDEPTETGGEEVEETEEQAPQSKKFKFKANGEDLEVAEDDPQFYEYLSFGKAKHAGLQELANQRKEFAALQAKELAEIQAAKVGAGELVDSFFQTEAEELKKLKQTDPDEYLRRVELRDEAVKAATEIKKVATQQRHLDATQYLTGAIAGDVNQAVQQTFATLAKKGAAPEATAALVEFANGPVLELLNKGRLYEELEAKAKARETQKAEPPAKKSTKAAPSKDIDDIDLLFGNVI